MNLSFRHKVPPPAEISPERGIYGASMRLNRATPHSALRTSPAIALAKVEAAAGPHSAFCSAFTLIELLVVITIIGLLLGLGLPMIKGMNKSNSMVAANRQLLDDINYARQRAIGDHTSVYIVFVPPTIVNWTVPTDPSISKVMTNLYGGQYTMYALLSLRSVGEQPGRSTRAI